MPVNAQLPKDSPLMIAWEAYKATTEYENTRRWARLKEHVDGSLWAAFIAGYEARRAPQGPREGWTAEDLTVRFHEAYERLAPQFGYETREETREFNPDSHNGKLMLAVCREILAALPATPKSDSP